MKAKHVFLTMGLALAMALGVGAAIGANRPFKAAQAYEYSGAQCGKTWYVVGTINGQNWADWNLMELNAETNRYEYTFEDASQVEFKLKNVNDWDGGIEINADKVDLDWGGKGWNANVQKKAPDNNNFETKVAGSYTVYFENVNDYDDYENGLWVFGIEKNEEPIDPSTLEFYVRVGGGSDQLMSYYGPEPYDEGAKTAYVYKKTIDANAGNKLFFKRGSETIQPGASDPNRDNNLVWNSSTNEIKVIQDVDDEELTLKLYEDGGYDTFLEGYAPNVVKHYFTNNQGWEGTPRYYVFNINDEKPVAWPGTEMTFVDVDGNGDSRYSFQVDMDKWPNFIICNNAGTDQTVNLDFASYYDLKGFYLLEREPDDPWHWLVSTYDYAEVTRKVNVGGTPYDLEESDPQPGGDVLVQYETDEIDITAGDQITYRIDGIAQTASLEQYSLNNGKIVEGDNYALVNATGKVYVKVMNDSSVKLYVEGLQDLSKGYHIFLNDNEIVELFESTEPVPEGFTGQRYSNAVTFHQNDKFKIIDTKVNEYNNALPAVFSPARFDPASHEDFVMAGGYIKYNGAADFEAIIYLKLAAGNDMVWVGETTPDVAAAKQFAQNFNDDIGGVCKYDGSTTQKTLEDMWAEQAEAYSHLSEGSKLALQEGLGSSITEIQDFYAKYDSVYRLRALGSGWNLENFLEVNYSSNYINHHQINTNSIFIVIVISSISLMSVGCSIFLFQRKRKHQ